MAAPLWLILTVWASLIAALGQTPIVSFTSAPRSFQIAGGNFSKPQILVSSEDSWGVIRAAGDLAIDFGRVTGTNFTLSNGEKGGEAAVYEYAVVAANYTHYSTNGTQHFTGPAYTDPSAKDTVIIAGTLGRSPIIDELVKDGKLNATGIQGKWESFVTQVVANPIPGCLQAVVIAGSDSRGTIYGLYDISEQIGVSPWGPHQ
ncbi:hypothetical protein NPX13_g9993 [Xylaria arbuscula]|uniref:Uncharacterized protein n=1 Tax=Xylaria arbuscula TaxID=114810 RepID=A0A9W8TIC4_9PEZI|nr:hypothetical protein NPX13_g9993 [Xylaria arbuscula]